MGDRLGQGDSRPLVDRLGGHVTAALISVGSQTTRVRAGTQTEAQVVDRAVLGAINLKGPRLTDALPLRFAVEHLEREAKQGVSLVQASYAPQSGAIFGILKQMKEDFESKLKSDQGDEKTAAQDYEALVAAKTEEIETMKVKVDTMQNEFYANQKAHGDAKEDLELTRTQRTEDVEFLRNLRLTCQDLDKQWELRSKARAEEMMAVTETIAIVTDDDAREVMEKARSFLQEQVGAGAALRARAAAALRRAAQQPDFDADDLLDEWHGRSTHHGEPNNVASPRTQLSALAVSV